MNKKGEKMSNPLGEYINTVLDNKKLSERDAAKLCDLSHGYLNQLINGRNPKTGKPISPTQETIKKLARGLEIDINFLTNLSLGFEGEEKGEHYLKINPELLELLALLPGDKQKCLIPLVKELLPTSRQDPIPYIPKMKTISLNSSGNIKSKFFLDSTD